MSGILVFTCPNHITNCKASHFLRSSGKLNSGHPEGIASRSEAINGREPNGMQLAQQHTTSIAVHLMAWWRIAYRMPQAYTDKRTTIETRTCLCERWIFVQNVNVSHQHHHHSHIIVPINSVIMLAMCTLLRQLHYVLQCVLSYIQTQPLSSQLYTFQHSLLYPLTMIFRQKFQHSRVILRSAKFANTCALVMGLAKSVLFSICDLCESWRCSSMNRDCLLAGVECIVQSHLPFNITHIIWIIDFSNTKRPLRATIIAMMKTWGLRFEYIFARGKVLCFAPRLNCVLLRAQAQNMQYCVTLRCNVNVFIQPLRRTTICAWWYFVLFNSFWWTSGQFTR